MRLPRRSALVTVALGALVLVCGACRSNTAAPSGRAAIAAAVGDTLPFQSRISGGFIPSKNGPTRAAGDRPVELSPDARIAIALIEKRAIESPTPEVLADLGVAYLVQGDIDRAITTLDDAASQLNTAAPWSDLSAAYLAKAERTPARRIELLSRALEAAEKSLEISKTNAALFNRSLARNGLSDYTGASAQWNEYLSTEREPLWKDAASRLSTERTRAEDANGWDARRNQLLKRLESKDTTFVTETTRLFPEGSIEVLERDLLINAVSATSASRLAAAIYEVTRDPMARDEAAALQSRGVPIALAHRLYSNAFEHYDKDDLATARKLFVQAKEAFSRLNAPYRSWAEFGLALIDWREGAPDLAQRRLVALEQDARRRAYTTLLGRVRLQQGLTYNRQWQVNEGLRAFRDAAERFEAAGEFENAASAYSYIADALRTLGESNESWSYIGRSLDALPRVRKASRRYLALYNASLFASRQELYEAALLFQDATVREAERTNDGRVAEALVHRAVIHLHRGDQSSARADFESASRRLTRVPEGSAKAYVTAELAIMRAQLPLADPSSTRDLSRAIDFFSRDDPGRVPSLYLLLSRVSGTRGPGAATTDALRSGIERLESQQAGLGEEALRISFFDESWALFQDMVAAQLAAGNTAQAFEYAERARARILLSTARGTQASVFTLAGIQARLPASTVMLHYTVLADRLLIWTITRSAARLTQREISERALTTLVDQQRASIRDRRVFAGANDRLYQEVIAPAAALLTRDTDLVVVPHGPLQRLSFATLRNPATRRYLIEDHALMTAPSATFFVGGQQSHIAATPPVHQSALLIGNPAASGARSLPGAAAEAEATAALYPQHQVMTGALATKDRFLQLAPEFDVVHFGGHAVANPEFPLLSRLLFADHGGGEQALYAYEIARVKFPRTRVVVLAACSTAAGAVSRGEGVVSIARPFLGGGVPLVIASQWDVDDRATEQLTLAFHRRLATSTNAIHALQAAQLSLLHSGDAIQSLPDSWGAFVAVGTATR